MRFSRVYLFLNSLSSSFRKTTKDKEEEFRHNFNEQTRRFTGEIEKLKDIIANNAKENSSLQKKNEVQKLKEKRLEFTFNVLKTT